MQTTTPRGYDYSRLIKDGMTNEEKISVLMNYSNAGGLIQAFVLEGLRKYAEQILESQEELKADMARSFIAPEAWIQCAADVLSALDPKPKELPPCHVDSPHHEQWKSRVEQLESEGLDTSDAQGCADAEFLEGENAAPDDEEEDGPNMDLPMGEHRLIWQIVDRYRSEMGDIDRQDMELSLVACHANGCPLDLRALLAAEDDDFTHDVTHIVKYVDEKTGKLRDQFLPRLRKKD